MNSNKDKEKRPGSFCSGGRKYKIVCKDISVTDIYIDNTTEFTKCKYYHKIICIDDKYNVYDCKFYIYIRDYSGWDNWKMIEIEKYSYKDSNEVYVREIYWKVISVGCQSSQIQ